jgi:hypothetical protein
VPVSTLARYRTNRTVRLILFRYRSCTGPGWSRYCTAQASDVDRHLFDADQDPDTTFHFDDDPDPDPTPNFTHVRKSGNIL